MTYFEDGFSQSDEIYGRVGDGDILTDGLSAFWKFDDGGGLTAVDSSGSGRHGTVEGSTWSNGIIGGALDFDGVNDKVSFPSPSLASFSLSAWVSADSKGNSVLPRIIHTDEFILYWGRRDGDPDPLEPDNRTVKFASERDDEEGIWNSANNVVDDGPWYHIAAAYDATSEYNAPVIYVDGERVPTGPQIAPSGDRFVAAGIGYIGDNGADERNWDGLIDEVRIYDRLLKPSEVLGLASQHDLNELPVVSAGGDSSAVVGLPVSLSGQADDPDNSPASLSLIWETVSGPNTPQFSDPTSLVSQVSFPASGDYRLRLLASDGDATASADVTFTVTEEAAVPQIELTVDRVVALRNPNDPIKVLFTADITPTSDLVLTVGLSGSAASGVDFEPFRASIVIPAGDDRVEESFIPRAATDPGTPELLARITLLPGEDYGQGQVSEVEVSLLPYLWENWLLRYLGDSSIPFSDELVLADPDNDGVANFLEYALGGTPLNDSGAITENPLPEVFLLTLDDEAYLALKMHRIVGTEGVVYNVEVSDGLEANNWLGGGSHTGLFQIVDQGDGTEEVVYRDLTPISAFLRRFIRLRVEFELSN